MRCAICLMSVVALAGCTNNQASFNPFGTPGPAVLPPPSTGSAGRPDPYYRPPAPGANPAGAAGYGVGWNGQQMSAPQLARFTSEQPIQTQVADQRAGLGNVSPSPPTPAYSPPPPGASGFATPAGGQPAAATSAPGYQPPAMNPSVSGTATQLPPSQPGFTPRSTGLGQY